ncbi:4-coumarate--CoA ligase 4 [Amphibalanus amphitrite]|uniref:4-coumarate--CoA ligase 4 n=1 Tax=Amphibalanus amphitrite TaxID=1232801 RepID=A0A6A4VSA7_AMPAM|nr:4-coumarate--CoA ligase 4 [Amphibalanus amphitrite]
MDPEICHHSGTALTFAETYRNVLRVSAALHGRGYRHGDVVAAALPNCVELPILVYSCAARGIITTTMNPLYTEGESLEPHTSSGNRGSYNTRARSTLRIDR